MNQNPQDKMFDECQVQVRYEWDVLSMYMSKNMRLLGYSKSQMAKVTTMPKEWITNSIQKEMWPSWNQSETIAKVAKLHLSYVFGTPKLAALRYTAAEQPNWSFIDTIYTPRKNGQYDIHYENETQVVLSFKAVFAHVQNITVNEWEKRFAKVSKLLETGKIKFSEIDKICDELDVTVVVRFNNK